MQNLEKHKITAKKNHKNRIESRKEEKCVLCYGPLAFGSYSEEVLHFFGCHLWEQQKVEFVYASKTLDCHF